MPAKYFHGKKRPRSPKKQTKRDPHAHKHEHQHHYHGHEHARGCPHMDRCISQTAPAMAKLERTISRILLIRFQQDIVRLSIYIMLPSSTFRRVWSAWAVRAGSLRTSSATRSRTSSAGRFPWTCARQETAWRPRACSGQHRSATSCECPVSFPSFSPSVVPFLRRFLHGIPPLFATCFGPMTESIREIIKACRTKYAAEGAGRVQPPLRATIPRGRRVWRARVRAAAAARDTGVEMTDHLSEVCERTVRLEEEESGVTSGKERESTLR